MGSGAFLVQACRWLSERLVEAWAQEEDKGKVITSDGEILEEIGSRELLRKDAEDRLLTARRLIAEQCLYGVDINPLAVELAKLSIWLVTLAKGRPFGFLDHNLRCGNSLLGIKDLEQLEYLEMNPGAGSSRKLFASKIRQAVRDAIELRSKLRRRPIHDIRDVEIMARLDEEAHRKVQLPELVADGFIGEVFAANGKQIDNTPISIEAGAALDGETRDFATLARRAQNGLATDLQQDKQPRRPFHWPLEFPEVFDRDNGGFDAMIGNPPFLGGKKISGIYGEAFREYLVVHLAKSTRGHADLIAYFFLRVPSLVRCGGTFGLIASNSIAEGDTRDVGLQAILKQGSTIYNATRSETWPGAAAVATSRVHIYQGNWAGDKLLDKISVAVISASLNNREDWVPVKLSSNLGLCFQGSIILGLGFTMSPEEAAEIIRAHSGYDGQVLFPYLTGREVNSQPTPTAERWVINFWDWSEAKAKTYPDLYERVLRNVKPERDLLKDNVTARGYKEKWWRFGRDGKNLYHAIGRGKNFVAHPDGSHPSTPLEHVIVFVTQATKYPCFTLVPNVYVYGNALCVVGRLSFPLLAVLSSDIHGIWAFEHGSRLEDRLRYSHGDIFETFPFPDGVLEGDHQILHELGHNFFEMRRNYMIKRNEGMTGFYNDLHDPENQDGDVEKLRNLIVQLNDAVLAAYAFEGIKLQHGFHQVGYLPEGKNTRFTISEAARMDLLHGLAMINKARHDTYVASTLRVGPSESGDSGKLVTQSRDGLFEVPNAIGPVTGRGGRKWSE
jgi:hypothetical protein